MKRIALLGLGLLLAVGATQARAMSESDIRQQIIRESIRSHGGYCVCPYQKDRKGRRCGIRSQYNRGGGYPPQCYAHDVDQDSIAAWINEHEHPSR